MLEMLAEQLPAWRPLCPAGGASMWIQLPDGYSATALAEIAGRGGVDVLPGPTFSCRDDLDGWVRVSFAVPPDVLRAGLTRLAAAWTSVSEHSTRRLVLSR
jgi:DNA-binding transcriptional MocR family regulator